MSGDRSATLHPRQRLLKRDCRDLVEACGGDEAAALACRVGKSQLSDYGNKNVRAFMPIDVVEDLEAIAGPIVSRGIAERNGYELDRRPEALPGDVDWCVAIAEAVREFSEAQGKILQALPNGVSAAEIRDGDILKELTDARRAIGRLEQLCERALEEDGR